MDYREELTNRVIEYCSHIPELNDEVPSPMLIDFVIEKYKQHRNYPGSFTTTSIEEDIMAHIGTIAMACVDVFCKVGMEGETSHRENGTTRQYENAYISASVFNDILPYVKILTR